MLGFPIMPCFKFNALQDESKAIDLLEQLSVPAVGHAWARFGLATILMRVNNRPGGDALQVKRAVDL